VLSHSTGVRSVYSEYIVRISVSRSDSQTRVFIYHRVQMSFRCNVTNAYELHPQHAQNNDCLLHATANQNLDLAMKQVVSTAVHHRLALSKSLTRRHCLLWSMCALNHASSYIWCKPREPELAVEKMVHAYGTRHAASSIWSFPKASSLSAHYSLGLDAAEFP
jgi:hypothetical protein